MISQAKCKTLNRELGGFPTYEKVAQYTQFSVARINYEGHRGIMARHLSGTDEMPDRFVLLTLSHLNSGDRQKFEDELLKALQGK